MEALDMPRIHDTILKYLLNWRKKHPGFTFTLRKSDLSKRLSSGYWFHGNDDYIAISFWSGMDWQSKVPNIAFVIIPITGECFLQLSAKDSPEKNELIQSFFLKRFELIENNRAFYCAPLKFFPVGDYIKGLENFLTYEKILIDEVIEKNKKQFETKQNTKNRIGFINPEEFQKNLSRTQKFQRTKVNTDLPVALFEVEIENYGLIKNLSLNNLPPNAQWIFFTGENGTGKSTILKALATAFTNSNLGQGSGTHIRTNYSIGLTLFKLGKKSQRHRIKKDNTYASRDNELLTTGFASFGPVRLIIQEQMFSAAGKKPLTLSSIFSKPHLQLFSTTKPLIDIGYVYNRNQEASKELKNNREKLKFIIEAISSICDSIVDIHFSKGMRYYEVDKKGNHIGEKSGTSFQNLASGYKSIIGMVSHMMLHLYHQQPNIDDPSLLVGIVIIDEIDLHFHPRLQRDLVIKLTEIFPRIQFIASTHSPIPLLGVPTNTPIFTVKLESERGIYIERMDAEIDVNNLLPNSILTSPIFNLQEIIPVSHSADDLINTEDNFTDVLFYKILDEKLNQINEKYKFDD
jgi:predicted ATPase